MTRARRGASARNGPPTAVPVARSAVRSAARAAGFAAARVAALVTALVVALSTGACVTGTSRDAAVPSADTPPLSVSLARFRTPSSSAADEPVTGARIDAASRISSARPARGGAPFRAPPRALDPVPPLYVPPSRTPALQPILDVPLVASSGPRPSRAHRSGARGVIDPLRRIDPVSGRDPLGRLDPSGGVGLADTLAR